MNFTIIGFWGGFPEYDEPTSGYLLENNNEKILIDCGSGVLTKIQKYMDINKLKNVIISHEHYDHISDFHTLKYNVRVNMEIGKRKEPLTVYAHESIENLSYGKYVSHKKINENSTIYFNNIKSTFFLNNHPKNTLSMCFESEGRKIVYISDTEWKDGIVEFAKNSDLLICESTLYKEDFGKVRGHLTAYEAGKIAFLSSSKELILTHLPHYKNHKDLLSQARETFDKKISLAKCGMKIYIS